MYNFNFVSVSLINNAKQIDPNTKCHKIRNPFPLVVRNPKSGAKTFKIFHFYGKCMNSSKNFITCFMARTKYFYLKNKYFSVERYL